MALKTGFFFGAPEGVREMDWISLLLLEEEGLERRVALVSLVSCFISLRRWREMTISFCVLDSSLWKYGRWMDGVAYHAVRVVVGGFMGLEFVHARVAFLA